MKKNETIGERYSPAMKITDPKEAKAYFDKLVDSRLKRWPKASREDAEMIEKDNLGYFAGYFSDETRARVERLFNCSHPVFGNIRMNEAPSVEESLEAGKKDAKKIKAAKKGKGRGTT